MALNAIGPLKKYKAYVINLDSAKDRWAHMQSEFKDTVLNLIRFPAIKNKIGWHGCGESYVKLIKEHMAKDPELEGELLIVLEDDLFRLQDVDTFNERCLKLFKYLEDHRGEYSHFQGGGMYPQGFSVVSRDPLILGCDYITGLSFTVFGKAAALSVLEWDGVRDQSIDNYVGNKNFGKMLAPYPHLVWQIIGLPSQIGDNDYTRKINNEFRKSHKVMTDFVKKQPHLNFASMLGGARRRGAIRRKNRSRKAYNKKRKTQRRRRD
jgi:hypothetical protein